MIFTSLAPNLEKDDLRLALGLMFRPWRWRKGEATTNLEKDFSAWLPARHAATFASGRSALFAILSCLDLKSADEVLLQAYTCVAVPDPILWAGARPVFVDCTDSYVMLPEDLERKITSHSRVLIVQHTFGIAADLKKLLKIARRHNLFVIEDCAHALGVTHDGRHLGTFGDASFFSFGRDKMISSVFGGMATTDNDEVGRKIRAVQSSWPVPDGTWVLRQLMHYPILWIAKQTYNSFGRFLLAVARRLGVITKAVHAVEKRGGQPKFVPCRMPNALAGLAHHQFKKLDRLNAHRREIVETYQRAIPGQGILRYTIEVSDPSTLRREARAQGIELGDWYDVPIAPRGVAYGTIGYQPGSCPAAERLAKHSVNLPTNIHITTVDAEKIISVVKNYVAQH